jgi:hypothetical protein
MKLKIALAVTASLCGSYALAQSDPRPEPGSIIATSNSSMLVKMTTSMSTTTSKPGDPIAGEVIDPRELRGAFVQGKVERADHDILARPFRSNPSWCRSRVRKAMKDATTSTSGSGSKALG